jgi:hypothetical protein
VKIDRSTRSLRLWIDARSSPGFSDYLIGLLPDLIRQFELEANRSQGEPEAS